MVLALKSAFITSRWGATRGSACPVFALVSFCLAGLGAPVDGTWLGGRRQAPHAHPHHARPRTSPRRAASPRDVARFPGLRGTAGEGAQERRVRLTTRSFQEGGIAGSRSRAVVADEGGAARQCRAREHRLDLGGHPRLVAHDGGVGRPGHAPCSRMRW